MKQSFLALRAQQTSDLVHIIYHLARYEYSICIHVCSTIFDGAKILMDAVHREENIDN